MVWRFIFGYCKPFAMILRGTSGLWYQRNLKGASSTFSVSWYSRSCADKSSFAWFAFPLVELYSFFKRLRCVSFDCLSMYPFVDQSRVLPDANLQKLRVDRCKVGWFVGRRCGAEWETWLWFACRGTGDSTGGRAHSHERAWRLIRTVTCWCLAGWENDLHDDLAEIR